jgi:hypothetical protein
VYKGRLDDLGLLCGSGSAHGRRLVAVGRCVARVSISFSLRLGLEGACAVAVRGWAHGGRGGRDVHGVSGRRKRRARRGQDGYRLVEVGIVWIGGEGTPAGLCDRSHGVGVKCGEQAPW